MNESNNFELKKFQSEVVKQYDSLKRMDEGIVQSDAKNPSGNFVWKGFVKVIAAIEKTTLQDFFAKPDVIEYVKRAKYLVSQPDVKEILCGSLTDAATENLLDIEIKVRTVKVITSLLDNEQIIKKFSIESDAHLFSFMAREILREGIENYCKSEMI